MKQNSLFRRNLLLLVSSMVRTLPPVTSWWGSGSIMCSTPTKPTATSTERSGRLSPTGTLTSSPTNTTLRFSRCTTDPSTTRCVRAKTRFFSIVVKNLLPQPNMIPICLPANDNSLVGEVKVVIYFFFILFQRWERWQAGEDCPSTDKYLRCFGKFNCQLYQTANVCGCIGV